MPKKIQVVPAPLVAVVLAVIVSEVLALPIRYIEIPANLLASTTRVDFSQWPILLKPDAIITALTIAFIASAETLLTCTALDKMTKRVSNYNREVFAQGVGNTIAGFLGALPITGVIVRSATNVQAGAKSQLSAILHGSWLLLFVLAFPAVLNWIPISSLAAILVYTGYKLMNPEAVKALWKFGKTEVGIYFATVIGIVVTNLLEGVLIGLGLSLIKLIYAFVHLDIRVSEAPQKNQIFIHIEGSATFINLPRLAEVLENLPEGKEITLYFDKLNHIDHACIDLIDNWEKQYNETGGQVDLEWNSLLCRFPKFKKQSPPPELERV